MAGDIEYRYDATGGKLRKKVQENGVSIPWPGGNLTSDITTTSFYADGFIYETKAYTHATLQTHLGYTLRLQYILHPEGRVRFVPGATAAQNKLVYDYHLTDHVGNVRVVLTEETFLPNAYTATMEDAVRADEEMHYEGIGSTVVDKPTGFDGIGNNHKVSRLFNVSGQDKRIGPAIALKVMTGDKITATVRGWYLPGSSIATPAQPVTIENLLGAVFGAALPVGSKIPGATAATGMPLNIQPFINHPERTPNTDAPKAFLSYLLLDEVDLKLVGSVYGSTPIPRITGGMTAQVMQAAGGAEINITKNGYLFVFVSNESQGNVYFDDLTVTHTPGPLLEEHHYYPTGLEMFALSSNAGNGHVRNRYTYQGQERENTFALNLNEFEARHYDGQIGRWMVPDPAQQFPSPYVGMGNQWVSTIDPDGRIAFVAVLGIAVVTGGYAGASIQSGNWNPAKWDNDWYNGALKGAMLATSIATGGVGSGLLGTKAATSFGAFKAAKTAKILANTMSGLINMTNYHDPDVGFGLHSIARFAAGYFGSAIGTTEGGDVVGGMFVGGVLNAGVSAAFEKGINEYGLAQAFVGGALASMSGHSFYKSTSTAWGLGGSESKYLINKYYDKMLTYGFQNLANNFAFDDEQKFFNKHWTTHFASFTVGAAGGQMQYEVMNNSSVRSIENYALRFFTKFTLSFGLYTGEYMLNYRAKTDGIYVNWNDFNRFKSNANILKSFFYSFTSY